MSEGCDCDCGHPMTVRDLISQLIESTRDLDAVVDIAVESGRNIIAFVPYMVHDVNEDEDGRESRVVIYAAPVYAWDVETNEELQAGVIILEEPVDA